MKHKENYVYLLQKALYGTKQAAHAWQQHLKQLMIDQGFISLILDPATYVKRKKAEYIIVGTHVDDLFVLFSEGATDLKKQLWAHLSSKLAIKNLGEAVWTLQMQIQAGILKISQENFVVEVLRRFAKCKTCTYPSCGCGPGSYNE